MGKLAERKNTREKLLRKMREESQTRHSTITILDPQGNKTGDTVTTLRSTRDDPLGWMHDRKQVTDYQYQAGRTIQQLYYNMGLGGISAVDMSKPFTDGGLPSEGNMDKRIAASNKLKAVYKALGEKGAGWIEDMLFHCMDVRDCSAKRGHFDERYQRAAGIILKEHLDTAAVVLGHATETGVPVIPTRKKVENKRLHPFNAAQSVVESALTAH